MAAAAASAAAGDVAARKQAREPYTAAAAGNRIISCQRNGVPVRSAQQIYSSLFLYHISSMHTKSHTLSNALVQQLLAEAGNGVAGGPLAPCTYNTVALHVFLVHTPFSPISQSWLSKLLLVDTGVERASVLDESTNMVS
jgi:hypothetical protein